MVCQYLEDLEIRLESMKMYDLLNEIESLANIRTQLSEKFKYFALILIKKINEFEGIHECIDEWKIKNIINYVQSKGYIYSTEKSFINNACMLEYLASELELTKIIIYEENEFNTTSETVEENSLFDQLSSLSSDIYAENKIQETQETQETLICPQTYNILLKDIYDQILKQNLLLLNQSLYTNEMIQYLEHLNQIYYEYNLKRKDMILKRYIVIQKTMLMSKEIRKSSEETINILFNHLSIPDTKYTIDSLFKTRENLLYISDMPTSSIYYIKPLKYKLITHIPSRGGISGIDSLLSNIKNNSYTPKYHHYSNYTSKSKSSQNNKYKNKSKTFTEMNQVMNTFGSQIQSNNSISKQIGSNTKY